MNIRRQRQRIGNRFERQLRNRGSRRLRGHAGAMAQVMNETASKIKRFMAHILPYFDGSARNF